MRPDGAFLVPQILLLGDLVFSSGEGDELAAEAEYMEPVQAGQMIWTPDGRHVRVFAVVLSSSREDYDGFPMIETAS
jgi:hypothetical protein